MKENKHNINASERRHSSKKRTKHLTLSFPNTGGNAVSNVTLSATLRGDTPLGKSGSENFVKFYSIGRIICHYHQCVKNMMPRLECKMSVRQMKRCYYEAFVVMFI